MGILLVGLVTGLFAKSIGQLVLVAAISGLVVHGIPRSVKSLRDISAVRSASDAERAEARAVGINVDAAARLTAPYAIAVHSIVGIVGAIVVALGVMGVRSVLQ